MGKRFSIKAGARTRVLWLFSSSIPGSVHFTATAPGGGTATGTVELHRRRWLAGTTETFPLQDRNVFDKGFSDADYRIYVTPDQDCEIAFETRHFRAGLYFPILAAVLILGIIAAITAFVITLPAGSAGS